MTNGISQLSGLEFKSKLIPGILILILIFIVVKDVSYYFSDATLLMLEKYSAFNLVFVVLFLIVAFVAGDINLRISFTLFDTVTKLIKRNRTLRNLLKKFSDKDEEIERFYQDNFPDFIDDNFFLLHYYCRECLVDIKPEFYKLAKAKAVHVNLKLSYFLPVLLTSTYLIYEYSYWFLLLILLPAHFIHDTIKARREEALIIYLNYYNASK